MKRHLKRIGWVALTVACIWLWGIVTDSSNLQEALLRLHVVGASDSREDQAVKLRVRDAVLASLEEGLRDMTDPQAAYEYVARMLPQVEGAANRALAAAGFSETVEVSLTEEAFPTREYDTFSLPAGVYKALRVVIGEGEGKNWWCVVFPQLCMGTEEEFVETANAAGLDPELAGTLERDYELRFWVLEKLGELKNHFFDPST
ncbi:MAG: stage II sporulation protein R [Oscillospiraceae bacterium]|nr:stage II sporulation protein R [Oscillospiraceae bacterium]